MTFPENILTGNGLSLKTRKWTNDTASSDIIILHGYLEHSGRYGHFAEYLNIKGYNCYSYDQRGHGLSQGMPSYISHFDDFVDDFMIFHKAISDQLHNSYFIMGHSMGALLLLSALLLHKFEDLRLKGIILSAPFIQPSSDLAPSVQKFSKVMGRIWSKMPTLAADPEEISRDPKEIKKYAEDPLIYHDKVHAGSARQLLLQMEKLRPHYHELLVPFLILHGTEDKVAEFNGSDLLFLESRSKDKQFIPMKEFRHEVLNDFGREKAMYSIVNWMDAHLSENI